MLIPSVAATLSGAVRFRYPVLLRLAALNPAVVIALTVYAYEIPGTALTSEYVSTAPTVASADSEPSL